MTDKERRVLEILNKDLSPWVFTGDEPMVQRLFEVIRGGCRCLCHADDSIVMCEECCDGP